MSNNKRKNWNEFFMTIAYQISERSTCDRKHVGCLLVKDNRIITTGYNGSIAKTEHCDDYGHIISNNSCTRTIHAEQNAICQAAKNGINISNSVCYSTCEPCWVCFKLLLSCNISVIYFSEKYSSDDIVYKSEKQKLINQLGIVYEQIKN